MKDLFRSEWRRFRRVAIIVAVLHDLALVLMSRAFDVPQLGYQDQAAMLAVYMVLGLVLAFVQVGSYRQTSRWLWLIHRPLSPARIFGALALSALAVLGVVIIVPSMLFLIVNDAFTAQVVDTRHYVTVAIVLAFAMMAWLAGAHASTSRSKVTVVVLLAPLMLALHLASVWWLLLPVMICVAWMVFIARHSFRADRHSSIASPGVLLLTALPLQLAFFLLVFQASKASVALVDLLGRSGPGRTVLQSDPNVDVDAMMRNMSQSFIAKGLENSQDSRVAGWREQLPLLDVAGIMPTIERFGVRHQLGNVTQPWWDDKRNIKWTFSHDRMMFSGRDLSSHASNGLWGTGGLGSKDQFTDVPASNMTRRALYAIDGEMQRQHEIARLPEGEWFLSYPVNDLNRVLLLTNKRLLAYRKDGDALSQYAPLKLDWSLPFAKGEAAPLSVDIAELLDGWLVSLMYSDAREFDGFGSLVDPWQQVVFVGTDGSTTVVGDRRNLEGYGVSFVGESSIPSASWWVSPPLYALAHVPDVLNTGLAYRPRIDVLPRVPMFYPMAFGLMLISLAAGYFWLRGAQVRASRRRLWLVSCALLGLPAFLSMICLEPRAQQH